MVNLYAPFYLVRVIRGTRHYWTGINWSSLYWDAQHYVSRDVAYRAATRQCWPAEVVGPLEFSR